MRIRLFLAAVAAAAGLTGAEYTFTAKDRNKSGDWITDGVEPGRYYLHLDVREGRSGLTHSGRRVAFTRGTAWEKRADGKLWMTLEAGPVEVKKGEAFRRLDHTDCGDLRLSREPLKHAPQKFYMPEGVFPDMPYLTEGKFEGGKAKVKVTNRTGSAKRLKVRIEVTDFFQRTLAAKEWADEEVAGERTFEVEYVDNLNGQFRARVELEDAEGRKARKIIPHLADAKTANRELVRFNEGWERASAKAKKAEEVTRVQAEPPKDAKWGKVAMPSEIKGDMAWFRAKKKAPASFAGKEVWFKVHRMVGDGELRIDGKKAGDLAKDRNFSGEFEINVTKFVKPGEEHEFLISARPLKYAAMAEGEPNPLNPNPNRCVAQTHLASGIGELALEARGTATVGKVRVETSYRNKEIRVRAEAPAGHEVKNTVWHKDEKLLEFGEKAKWENPPLWGPEEFPLLRLVTELKDGAGRVVDEKVTRFGFREFWAEGMDLKWNGVTVRGDARAFASTWGWNFDHRVKRQENCNVIYAFKERGARFLRHIYNGSEFLDFCDEAGMPAAKGGMTPGGPAPEKSANKEYWRVKKQNDLAMIETCAHHPSVMTWYLSNEYYGEADDRHFAPLKEAVRNVRAADPTRFAETGCDIDLRGESDIVSTHYAVELGALRNEGCFMPDCFMWRHSGEKYEKGDMVPKGQSKAVANCPILSPIKWGEKPIVVNETCWDYFFAPPFGYTRMAGDEVFLHPTYLDKWHMEAAVEAVRGHREAGCTLWTPWRWATGDNVGKVSPPVDATTLQRYGHGYAGTVMKWDAVCHYDEWKPAELTWGWRLEDSDGKVVRKGERETVKFEGAATLRREIKVRLPKPGRYRLRYGLEGRCEKELAVTSHKRGKFEMPANAVTAEMKLERGLLEKAEGGETVVVLAREDYPDWLPEITNVTGHDAAILRSYRRGHPLLAGIGDDELSYFYPGSAAVKGSFLKPLSGRGRTVLEAGGASGLGYAALVEVPYGKGCFIYSRLVLEPETNPVAAKLLRNMGAYRAGKAAGPALYLAGKDEKLERALRVNWGAVTERGKIGDAGKYGAVIVDGSGDWTAADAEALRKCGKTVLVFNPGEAFGAKLRAVEAADWQGRAIKCGADELTEGMTNQDMTWRAEYAKAKSAIGNLGDAELAGEENALLYPAYLARRGNIVLATADPKRRHAAAEIGARRFWSALLGNAGVAVAPYSKPEMPKKLFYTQIDISEHFDRGLKDAKDDDGEGSWNDQGPEAELPMKTRHPLFWVAGVPYRVDTEKPCAFVLATEYRKGGKDKVTLKAGMTARTVSWLHTGAWTAPGKRHFTVRLRYEDGTCAEVIGTGGANVHDWGTQEPTFAEDTETICGAYAFRRNSKTFPKAHVYSMTAINPHPGKKIEAVEFERGERRCARVAVFALTLGRSESGYEKLGVAERAALHEKLVGEALAAEKAKRAEEAIAKYEEALRVRPELVWAYRSIGAIYEAMRDWEYALETYRRSLEADYNQPDVQELEKRMKKKVR